MMKIRGKEINAKSLAKMIDISYLQPYTNTKDIDDLLDICIKYDVNACCVNPNYLDHIVEKLKGTDVQPTVVIDFPFGAGTSEMKYRAAEDAVKRGAVGLDLVINIGALKDGKHNVVLEDVKNCVKAGGGMDTKIIIETAYLTDEEIATACKIVEQGGATHVKSSTGRDVGPDMKHVKIMRDSVSPSMKLKVAGTGRFWTTAVALGCIAAGVDLIGTRAGAQLVNELPLFEEIFSNIEFS